jgi:hypothetical protein
MLVLRSGFLGTEGELLALLALLGAPWAGKGEPVLLPAV